MSESIDTRGDPPKTTDTLKSSISHIKRMKEMEPSIHTERNTALNDAHKALAVAKVVGEILPIVAGFVPGVGPAVKAFEALLEVAPGIVDALEKHK